MIYNDDELSFQILIVDRFFHKKGVFDVDSRPYAAFSFRLTGDAKFEIAGKSFYVKSGDILYIPANMPYKVEYSCSESIVVHFSDCSYQEPENITPENPTAMEACFQRLLESWNETGSVNGAKSAVYDILERISRDKKMAASDTALFNCVRYLEEHAFDVDMDVEEICRIGFMSASSLQRAFNEHFGMSPKQYLIKLRMSQALTLLAEGTLSVKEISDACGFRDDKYFSRAFKRKYGYPPSHFQKKIFL